MFFLNQELAATTHPLADFFCLFSEAKPTIAKKKKKNKQKNKDKFSREELAGARPLCILPSVKIC